MALEPGCLYLNLFTRGVPNSYHWGLYYHWDVTRGTKFHIRNPVDNYWILDSDVTYNATKSFLLVGFIKIANVDITLRHTLESEITSVPIVPPSAAVALDCRVWVLEAVKKLMASGFVKCPAGIDALEAEAQKFAQEEEYNCDRNVQPRPIRNSTLCILN
ncbi:hypothetical protein OBBRIDRAFT_667702 [Obba rivulosa]|uniref:Uncharacterized protein n=1 Tax=Obba rivulosa TaxID=1052685 RepID=A0A8E2AW24_9APHY|nr:hypothetical protein OBBRIDRAFT_667702 [Obba rivulosa]